MARRFGRRRWRRPERMLLEHAPVARRKDLGASEPLPLEHEIAHKTSRRQIQLLFAMFMALAAVEGTIVAIVLGGLWLVVAAFVGYALLYLAIAREIGDAWLVRAVRARAGGSTRVVRLAKAESHTAGVSSPRVVVVAGAEPNAVALALRRRWLVATEAAESLDELALEGLVAHEVVHLRDGDAAVASLFVLLSGMPELSVRAGRLALLSLPLWPVALAMRLAQPVAFHPDREHRADIAAAMLTRYPPGIVSALGASGGRSCGLRPLDGFWFVPRGPRGRGPDKIRRAELAGEM